MRCGWIPALTLIDFIMESSVFTPSGALQYHTFSSELKPFTSLGRRKRQSDFRFSVRGNFFIVLTVHLGDSGTANIFASDSSLAKSRETLCLAQSTLLLEEWLLKYFDAILCGLLCAFCCSIFYQL